MRNFHTYFLFFMALILLASCNPTQKIIKSEDTEYKFDKAVEYYENKKYDRAMPIIEHLMPKFSYTDKGEELYFMYAMSHYNVRDYILAGYYLKKFTSKYPTSSKAEQALFLSAMCYVHESPNYSLDQTDTRNAINELQLFLNRFPRTEKKDTCNEVIDRLNLKLERKEYEKSKLYYKTENYKAAVVSIKANLEVYPNTVYKEELMYMLVKAGFLLADNSISSKKLERYEDTIKSYRNFAKSFPESDYLNELSKIEKRAVQGANNMRELGDN